MSFGVLEFDVIEGVGVEREPLPVVTRLTLVIGYGSNKRNAGIEGSRSLHSPFAMRDSPSFVSTL